MNERVWRKLKTFFDPFSEIERSVEEKETSPSEEGDRASSEIRGKRRVVDRTNTVWTQVGSSQMRARLLQTHLVYTEKFGQPCEAIDVGRR